MIRVEQEIPDQPEVARMFTAGDEGSLALYPGEERLGPAVEALVAADVRFFVARLDGRAVGCAGYVPGEVVAGGGGWVEMTRVFVDPAVRGMGIGSALMSAAEQLAGNEGFGAVRLETGSRASAAIGLYRSLGYLPRAPYGAHAGEVSSVFMEKHLGAGR